MLLHKPHHFRPLLRTIHRLNRLPPLLLYSLIYRGRGHLLLKHRFLGPEHSGDMLHCFSLWVDLVKLLSVLLLVGFEVFGLEGEQVEESFAVVLSDHFSNHFLMRCSL